MKFVAISIVLFFSLTSWTAINDSKDTFDSLMKKAQNSSINMDLRWSAILNAASLASGEELLKVVELANNKEWFVRNAVLVALDKVENNMVYDVAKKLVTDKSLVVRSAAVDVLSRLKSDETKKIFSLELEKKYNVSGKKSLWIREQMMNHLVENVTPAEKSFFVKNLFDTDVRIARLSALALEKITNVRFEGSSETVIVDLWKKHARSQKW